MRALHVSITALLVGMIAATAPTIDLQKDLMAAGQATAEMLNKARVSTSFKVPRTTAARMFAPQQDSTTCDQEAYADATANVLAACPSLSGLVTGSTAPEEFLPTFCGSDCYNSLSTELPKFPGCLDGTTLFLIEFVNTCKVRPQCFSSDFVGVGAKISADCGSATDAVMDMRDISDSSVTAVRNACSGDCITRQTALMRKFPECVRDEDGNAMPAEAMADLMDAMCTKENDEYCAISLKGVGKTDCSSNCFSDNAWCNEYCQLNLTTARLDSLCTPCVDKLSKNLAALGDSAGLVAASMSLFCQTEKAGAASSTNPYCFPLAMAASYAFSSVSYSSPSFVNATMSAVCTPAASTCTERTLATSASITEKRAFSTVSSCLTTYNYVDGTLSDSDKEWCVSPLDSAMKSAETSRALGRLICARNEAQSLCVMNVSDLGTYSWYAATNTSYYLQIGCPYLGNFVNNSGCCLPLIVDFIRVSDRDFDNTYLPMETEITYRDQKGLKATVSVTRNAKYAYSSLNSSQLLAPLAATAFCPNEVAFSELPAKLSVKCPTILSSPPTASIPLAISWEKVNADPVIMKKLKAAMRLDVSNAMRIAPSRIINDEIVENPDFKIVPRSSSKRQTATASGVSYKFAVDGATQSDAEAATGNLQSSIDAGTFTTPATDAAITGSCPDCLDARASGLAQASKTNDTPAPRSSAAGVSVAAVLAAAVVAMMF